MNITGKTFRLGGLLLVVCLISTVMLSGTFAKYTSEVAGQDTALVAKWSFTSTTLGTPTSPIDLGIWDPDYSTNVYQGTGDSIIAPGIKGRFDVGFTYDADVNAALTFKIEKSGNLSGVAAAVPIQYSLDSSFASDKIYYNLDNLAAAIIDTAPTGTISANGHYGSDGDTAKWIIANTGGGSSVTVNKTVYWRWPYDVTQHNDPTVAAARAGLFVGTGSPIGITAVNAWTDADDTALGKSSAGHDAASLGRDSYVLKITATATQVAPTTP